MAVEGWARRLDLPCAERDAEAGTCRRFTTAARSDGFWKTSVGELGGLDSVEVTLDGDIATVDFGDYLCSGPFL